MWGGRSVVAKERLPGRQARDATQQRHPGDGCVNQRFFKEIWNMAGIVAEPKDRSITVRQKDGKYLTFALAHEEYGLEILKVREIIGYIDVTAVPQTPGYIRGVINLRGQVIPVVDLRAKFGMETAKVTEETCIIVVEIAEGSRKFNTGIVVDRVQEVLDIAGADIEEAPVFDASVDTAFILGMAKVGESVKILLDIDKVLRGNDLGGLTVEGDNPQ